MTAYEILDQYADPGYFSLPVSSLKRAMIGGKQILYGPIFSGKIAKTDAGYSITLDTSITAEVEHGVHAKVTGFDVTQADTFALGVAGPFGLIAFRKKINLSFEDA